jgi:hypothetical protein
MDIYGNSPFKQLKVNHFMLSCLLYVHYSDRLYILVPLTRSQKTNCRWFCCTRMLWGPKPGGETSDTSATCHWHLEFKRHLGRGNEWLKQIHSIKQNSEAFSKLFRDSTPKRPEILDFGQCWTHIQINHIVGILLDIYDVYIHCIL